MLVFVEGMSYQEAAGVLAIPVGTLMSRLARARLALASRMRQLQAGEGSKLVENTG
jgi:RNA polymerase sigma-70 factor (ECF subfamily)